MLRIGKPGQATQTLTANPRHRVRPCRSQRMSHRQPRHRPSFSGSRRRQGSETRTGAHLLRELVGGRVGGRGACIRRWCTRNMCQT